MFGFFEAIYSFLTRQIGLRTDAASSTGSLHAKIGNIVNAITSARDYIVGAVQKPRSSYFGSYSANTNNSWVTVLNVTGKGSLDWLTAWYGTSGTVLRVRVTVDGVLLPGVHVEVSGVNTTYFLTPLYTYSPTPTIFNLNFKSSLMIEMITNSGYSGTLQYAYSLE